MPLRQVGRRIVPGEGVVLVGFLGTRGVAVVQGAQPAMAGAIGTSPAASTRLNPPSRGATCTRLRNGLPQASGGTGTWKRSRTTWPSRRTAIGCSGFQASPRVSTRCITLPNCAPSQR